MIKQQHLLSFDLFQHMVHWLSSSQHSYRKGRRYLESHPELLQMEADRELARLVRAHSEEAQEVQQPLRDHLRLLREARERGATLQAVREAYVNMYGGLSLDLPEWLEEIEKQRSLLLKLRRPDRTSRTHIQLLRRAIAQTRQACVIAPEISAELLNELGCLLVETHDYTEQQRLQAIEEAIHYHETAANIFSAFHYPLQHARTACYLGNACYHYARAGYHEAAERALSCYETALRFYTPEDCPSQWAMLHTRKGRIYTLQGHSWQHIEQAIACHKAALNLVSRESAPLVWAEVQINLGDTYRLRAAMPDQRDDSLRRAMAYYRAALQVYTPVAAAKEWADTHTRLAAIYQHYARDMQGEIEMQDKSLCCAIVCCESALQVYSPSSFPIEYAAAQVCLGHLHRARPAGERQANLEQARACYQHALHIFTSLAFPLDHRRALLALRETEDALHYGASDSVASKR